MTKHPSPTSGRKPRLLITRRVFPQVIEALAECFDIEHNEVFIFTDSGRLTRPIYYIENNRISYQRENIFNGLRSSKITWEQIVSGLMEKGDKFL